MAKRQNESSQIRREEYDAQESVESASNNTRRWGFEKASNECIAGRRIVKARVGAKPKKEPDTVEVWTDPLRRIMGSHSKSEAEKDLKDSTLNATKHEQTFEEAVQTLNRDFMHFIKKQEQMNPSSSWEGAVKDYLRYAAELKERHGKHLIPVEDTASASSISSTFDPSSAALSAETDGASGTFSFVKQDTLPQSKSYKAGGDALVKSNKIMDIISKSNGQIDSNAVVGNSAGPFSSNIFAASTHANAFGNTQPLKAFSFTNSVFSAPASAPIPAPASAVTNTNQLQTEEEESIGREEATVILKSASNDEICTFELDKMKLFEYKKYEKRWADKGLNALQLLQSKGKKNGSIRILIRNQIGKVVLNASVYKGMKIVPYESRGKKTGVILFLQNESEAMAQYILKMNESKVDPFTQALNVEQ